MFCDGGAACKRYCASDSGGEEEGEIVFKYSGAWALETTSAFSENAGAAVVVQQACLSTGCSPSSGVEPVGQEVACSVFGEHIKAALELQQHHLPKGSSPWTEESFHMTTETQSCSASASRTRPEPLVGLDVEKVSSGSDFTTNVMMTQFPSSATSVDELDGRCFRSQLGKSLQEETVDSIMGYTPRDPAAPCKALNPMLLGRHKFSPKVSSMRSERLDQVKSRAAEARKQQALRAFLVSSGFSQVNGQKKFGRGILHNKFAYPLHAAVTANDTEAVEVLLWAGANKELLDSQRLTPLALAQKVDKQGSHTTAIALLSK